MSPLNENLIGTSVRIAPPSASAIVISSERAYASQSAVATPALVNGLAAKAISTFESKFSTGEIGWPIKIGISTVLIACSAVPLSSPLQPSVPLTSPIPSIPEERMTFTIRKLE